MAKKKPSTLAELYERGYTDAAAVARGLRELAADVEENDVGQLVKFSITFWYASKPHEAGEPEGEG